MLMPRALQPADAEAVARILNTSDYIHYRFDADELSRALARHPAFGIFSQPGGPLGRVTAGTLQAFLLVTWLAPPSAWIGGFGISWSEGRHFERYLDALLPPLEQAAWAHGTRSLYYSGADVEGDWLRDPLLRRGFTQVSRLVSYEKGDFSVPSEGNGERRIRAFTPADVAAAVVIERAAFAPPWRHDAASFLDIAAHYPYFVVAEDAAGIVGYQFNTVADGDGYLVRIAVDPRAFGRGIGTRLMAEAVRFFERAHVRRILLNAEETNTRAHALYERFGFVRVPPQGFVLGHAIASP
jgi:GNAT superfamily N-acetyltransferase